MMTFFKTQNRFDLSRVIYNAGTNRQVSRLLTCTPAPPATTLALDDDEGHFDVGIREGAQVTLIEPPDLLDVQRGGVDAPGTSVAKSAARNWLNLCASCAFNASKFAWIT